MKRTTLKMIEIIRPMLLERGLYGELSPTELLKLLTTISEQIVDKILALPVIVEVWKECLTCVNGTIPDYPDGKPIICPDCNSHGKIYKDLTIGEALEMLPGLIRVCKWNIEVGGILMVAKEVLTSKDGWRL